MAIRSRATALISLADKPGPLKREDVMCPICWSVLMQPVGLPCKHNLCLDCFKKHVEETSLQCPCCRMRLSVWSRRAFRENNLVDTKLWDRIQKEFPKLVQTRMCGEDSQDLLPEDLISVHDKNGPPQMEASVEESPPKRFVRDGDYCTANGDIRRELESTLKKHQEDIENQHRIEETASVDLIRQLQEQGELSIVNNSSTVEEDSQLARKLVEDEKNARLAEITARRKLFTEPSGPSSSKKVSSTTGTKLISEWANCTPPNSSISQMTECNGITTPKTSGKRPSLSSLSSRSVKKTKKTNTRNSLPQKSSSQSHGSQSSILSYLSGSSRQSDSDDADNSRCSRSNSSPQPSTSAAAINKIQGNQYENPLFQVSAFSPTKSYEANKIPRLIPGGLIYKPVESVSTIINRFKKFSQESQAALAEFKDEDLDERDDTSSPNSIDLEVNSHFRPIRTAPKTPPKRMLNGKYLPEPVIVKTTPVKVIAVPAATKLKSTTTTSYLSSTIINSPGKPNKIACEDGKRISDDSGRASVSSLGSDSVVEILSDSESGFFVAKSASQVKIETVANKSSVKEEDSSILSSTIPASTSTRSAAVTVNRSVTPTLGSVIPAFLVDYSPSSASDLQRKMKGVKKEEVDYDLPLFKDDDSLTSSQDSRLFIDFKEVDAQAQEFERIRLKLLQEVEDRKVAQKLQRDLNRSGGILVEKRTSLRSWLKKTPDDSGNSTK